VHVRELLRDGGLLVREQEPGADDDVVALARERREVRQVLTGRMRFERSRLEARDAFAGRGEGGLGELAKLPAFLRRDLLVAELVYNPPETPLLRAARIRGARTVNGLPMLVYQGAAAFELWTGRPAPIELMRRHAREALGV